MFGGASAWRLSLCMHQVRLLKARLAAQTTAAAELEGLAMEAAAAAADSSALASALATERAHAAKAGQHTAALCDQVCCAWGRVRWPAKPV